MLTTKAYKSVYIYTGEQMETTLFQLFRLLDTFPEATNDWFFIRYSDDRGLHIRYRIAAPYSVRIIPAIQEQFPNHSLQDYQPETDRYGGPVNLPVCEQFFNFSSNLIKSIYTAFESLDYDNRMLFALTAGKKIYTVNFPHQTEVSIRMFRDQWLSHNCSVTGMHETFFTEEYTRRSETLLPGILQQTAILDSYLSELCAADSFVLQLQGVTSSEKTNIINSLIHMSNNRFGITNLDESFLAHLTERIVHFERHNPLL